MKLMVSKKTLNTLLAGAVALTIAGAATSANATDENNEKCYGVVKAGHNDCAAADGTHSCAGHAGEDADGQEWVALPQGVCDKLVGGSLEPVAADHEQHADDEEHGEQLDDGISEEHDM